MTEQFNGKTVFITGAASGIGLATARSFAEAGANVVLADLDEGAASAAATSLQVGDRAVGIACDVADEASVEAAVQTTVTRFGRLDIAFNNAGIHVPVADTADASTEDFDQLMGVNLRGTWLSMKHELRVMAPHGEGAIINCSSQNGITGAPGLGAYVTSKHAVIGMTRAASLEYARRGIRINAVCPGATETPMVMRAIADHPERMAAQIDQIPIGRLAPHDEIASVVLWLASPGAAFMIGQAVVPDGGYTVL